MKGEQKYATKIFNELKNAEGFKARVGERAQIIRQDKLGRYKVKFKIDKTRPKTCKHNHDTPNFEEHWKF
jgi:L-2-hydroxyglutarate oxidase LhgO